MWLSYRMVRAGVGMACGYVALMLRAPTQHSWGGAPRRGEPAVSPEAMKDEMFADRAFFEPDNDGMPFSVNLNDTFGWACADCEEIPESAVPRVYTVWKKFGDLGAIAWAEERRGIERSAYEFPGAERVRRESAEALAAAREWLRENPPLLGEPGLEERPADRPQEEKC